MAERLIPSSVQHITVTEAVQGGGANTQGSTLSTEQLKKKQAFVTAHAPQQTAHQPDKAKASAQSVAAGGGAQVSAAEQQQAVMSMGLGAGLKSLTKTKSKFQHLYETLFTDDEVFFQRDLMSEVDAIRQRKKSLVGISTGLSPEEKSLRRYLLLEHALNADGSLDAATLADVRVALNKVKASHGEYIAQTIGAYSVGRAKQLKGPGLLEFIRGYQFLGEQTQLVAAADLHTLYKFIKMNLTPGKQAMDKLTEMLKSFVEVLVREKTQRPSRATSARQYLMLSTIKRLNVLLAIHQDHVNFLAWATRCMRNLPGEVELTELSLQLVSTKETVPAMGTLVRLASAVQSDHLPARNAFMANYLRWLLLGKNLSLIYVSAAHRKVVTEQCKKNVESGAMLSIPASLSQA